MHCVYYVKILLLLLNFIYLHFLKLCDVECLVFISIKLTHTLNQT